MTPPETLKFLAIHGMAFCFSATLMAEEIWSFEEDPSQVVGGLIVLEPLSRSEGNVRVPAKPEVAAQTSSQHALSNPALMFEGNLSPIEIEKKSWTLSGWFHNAAAKETMSGVQSLTGTRQKRSRFKGWDLNMVNGALRFLSAPTRGEGRQFTSTKRYDDEKWHFFQLIWNSNSQEITLYVDGEKVGSAQDVPFNSKVPGQAFTIGAKIRDESRATEQEWDGEIDEWKFEPSIVAEPTDMKVSHITAPQKPTAPSSARPSTFAPRVISLSGQLAFTKVFCGQTLSEQIADRAMAPAVGLSYAQGITLTL